MNIVDAARQARVLGSSCVGPGEFLLALLSTANVASSALSDLGITYDRVHDHLSSLQPDPDFPEKHEPMRGVTTNHAAHDLMGWARGYALAAGAEAPRPEHWLLALLYMDAEQGPAWLHPFGVSARAVLNAVAARGIPTPANPPAEYRPWRGGRHVYVSEAELRAVLDVLEERHPPGDQWRWGFNRVGNPPRGRVTAEEGIQLEEIVAEARQRSVASD